MTDRADIAIIGAGAAGLAAGIFAAEAAGRRMPPRIVLLDGAKSVGAKILVSGGGRCNVTNEVVRPEDFQGRRPILRNILAAFDERATVRWFASLGVELKREETGKLFPATDRARTVLDALTGRCRELDMPILAQHRVTGLTAEPDGGFVIRHERGALRAARVVLATGGRSLPRTGSDGTGWEIVRGLGHTVTPTCSALVPFVLDGGFFHAELSGLSQETELTTLVNGAVADRRTGSLLWTHFGVSGPVVMDASRFWTLARATGQVVEVRASFLPGGGFDGAERWLLDQAAAHPRVSLGTLLAQRLPERLGAALCRRCALDPATQAGQLPREARRALLRAITALPLPIIRDRGWNFAEVTAGGVPLDEIDFRTMESRRVPGLYLVGELLDCDGRIGGFNFQWAWATGYLGGRGAAAADARHRGGQS